MPPPIFLTNAVQDVQNANAAVGNYMHNWVRSQQPTRLTQVANALSAGAAAPLVGATLLAYVVFAGRPAAEASGFRVLIAGWTQQALMAEMVRWMDFSVRAGRGSVLGAAPLLAPSFRHASSVDVNSVANAFGRATGMLQKAYLAAKKGAATAGPERDAMVTWFGAYDANRFGTVVANLKLLNNTLYKKQVVVYYRGSRITGPSDKPNETGVASLNTAFASAFRGLDLPAAYNRDFSHITLGQKFFSYTGRNAGGGAPATQAVGGGIAARIAQLNTVAPGAALAAVARRPAAPTTTTSGFDSIGGVLLHELSHHLCNTQDETHPVTGADTYGTADCLSLATGWPALAVNNADNYEYYCETFQ